MVDAGTSQPGTDRTGRPAETAPSATERWTLAAAVLGFFVVTLDAVAVNVALPAIRRDLGGGITGLQWVVDGYTLAFAALLLSAGALADRIGSRRAFGAGLVLFVLSSAACAAAPTLPVLVAYQNGDPAERAFWRRTIEASEQREEDLARALQLMTARQAIHTTLDRARRFTSDAKQALMVFPDNPMRRTLLDVADYTVSRAR